MARKADIKICRYDGCKIPEQIIDISKDEYVINKRKYYHARCWHEIEQAAKQEAEIKADIQLLKNMWIDNISSTVVISQLYLELNKLIRERGISSKYIVFVLEYCIKNKCKLRYPAGLKYYVDKEEILNEYKKKTAQKTIANAIFVAMPDNDDAPRFSVNRKPSGFNSILGGKR